MSAAVTAPGPTPQPATPPAGTDRPGRVASLLSLVRKLIDYGKELATTLRERGLTNPADAIACFGTIDIARILARITAGLHRAAALEARLLHCAPEPFEGVGQPGRAPSSPTPRAARQAAPPDARPDPRLARLPTPAQIAEEVRRRPVGDVIADICCDLGIRPEHPLWQELRLAIIQYDGNLVRFFKAVWPRTDAAPGAQIDAPRAMPASASPQSSAPASTGPP